MSAPRWSLLALLLSLAASPPLWGFELLRVNENPCNSGARNLYWDPPQVPVDASRMGGSFGTLVLEAQAAWNDVLAGRFAFVSGSGEACNLRDGVTSVDFATEICGTGGFGDALAVTRSSWRGDGSLIDADVIFNSDTFLPGNRNAFRQVAEHELGHVLGLDHSDSCGDSGEGTLMLSELVAPLLDGPQQDDIAGAQFIYGGSDNGGAVPEGANGCAVTAAPGDPRAALALLAFGAGIALGRRRAQSAIDAVAKVF